MLGQEHNAYKMPEVEVKHRSTAIESVRRIALLDASDYYRNELGAELSFEIAENLMRSIIRFYSHLLQIDFDNIPFPKVVEIIKQSDLTMNAFNAIKSYSVKGANPSESRDRIYNGLLTRYADSVEKLGLFISLFQKSTENDINNIIAELNDKKVEVTNELDQILETSRQTASKIGVSAYAKHFQDEAEMHKNASDSWLKALITLIVITICWGILCFFINPEKNETQLLIQYTVAKLIIISGLYYGLAMVSKNYKAHQHNYVVNRHKQNSLNSFESFVKGAGDDQQTKNAILLSATQSIFSSQASGYSSQDNDSEPNKIIEIFKTVGQTKQ